MEHYNLKRMIMKKSIILQLAMVLGAFESKCSIRCRREVQNLQIIGL